ncbi:MAG: class IV lanthionine synthetase LanL [Streptosporangiaceae bacterium]|nr:class IV lanthionine synthetase LanL [Streptosporangiaceae bacterium]
MGHPAVPSTPHGWKIHISARPKQLGDTIDRVLPILRDHVCSAKFARSADVLRELNSGLSGQATAGKAITVYPAQDDVVILARELVAALLGREGPRVLSDRQVHPDAPVYYRYGPFCATYRISALGDSELVMFGPNGQVFSGLAELTFRCPPWATDPFAESSAGPVPTATVAKSRFRITTGIHRAPSGNIYRAVAVDTGRRVVIKQARAWAGEDVDGIDARERLRHEHRVLAALSGVGGVPQVVDYVRQRADEYLVITDLGPRNLHAQVRASGAYSTEAWWELACRLLGLLDEIHARGVVVRDIKPHNVVLDERGLAHLIDFGISRCQGRQLKGATPGYSLAGQWSDAPAQAADDYYGLGCVLYYAATGFDPVCVAGDDATNRDRSLACLAAALPTEELVYRVLASLLSLDPDERAVGAQLLRSRDPIPAAALPSVPPRLAAPLHAIVDAAVEYCVESVERLLADDGARRRTPPVTGLYDGSAGIGLELAQHAHRPGVGELLGRLAEWTVARVPLDDLPPGLHHGRAGIALFLASAGQAADVPATLSERLSARPMRWWLAGLTSADHMHGLAGAGLGHLLVAARTRGAVAECHLALAAECRRRLLAGDYSSARASREVTSALGPDHDFAHGGAGVAYFLLEYAAFTGEPPDPATARICADLAAHAVRAVASPSRTSPGLGSWCGGLAGVGTTLARAGSVDPDGPFLGVAEQLARSCLDRAPWMPLVSQCCGLAGLGEFLIDLACVTGADEYWHSAADIAALILARSGGTPGRPVFPDHSLSGASSGWGTGTAGVLGFFRRLRSEGGVRPCLTH